MTIGPFTVKNRNVVKIIEEVMACFQFEDGISCQYDPLGIIQDKREKLKRGVYEHTGTERMNKLENKLVFSDGDESESEDIEIAKGLALVSLHEKGKMPLGQEKASPASKKKKVKRVKVLKQPPFSILEHSSPNIMMVKGEVTSTQSIIDHYSELNDQTKTNDQEQLRSTASPQLISALDREKQMLKVAIIQPSKAKNNSK